jgi:hypothetical protein
MVVKDNPDLSARVMLFHEYYGYGVSGPKNFCDIWSCRRVGRSSCTPRTRPHPSRRFACRNLPGAERRLFQRLRRLSESQLMPAADGVSVIFTYRGGRGQRLVFDKPFRKVLEAVHAIVAAANRGAVR